MILSRPLSCRQALLKQSMEDAQNYLDWTEAEEADRTETEVEEEDRKHVLGMQPGWKTISESAARFSGDQLHNDDCE